MLQFHIALGVTWILVFLVYGVFGVRAYLSQEVLQKEIALDRDDWRWLLVRALLILGRSKEALPPQGIYNAGQKLFALVICAMITGTGATETEARGASGEDAPPSS
jgi:cytochrome b subunit of formate dehydrogenase